MLDSPEESIHAIVNSLLYISIDVNMFRLLY